jgi:DNA-binding response OmpR family regulator
MHGSRWNTRRTILLVEAEPSLRRMIALGLQHRSLDVIEVASPDDLSITSKLRPDLILFDFDGEAGKGAALLAKIQADPRLASLPVVTLAWGASAFATPAGSDNQNPLERSTNLAKPFDARALYAAIESQLSPHHSPDIIEQEHIRPAYLPGTSLPSPSSPSTPSTSAAPSFCPVITAAGLLLVFIGLLLQIVITAVGLLIVVAALLWWTLGTKPENMAVAR